MARTIAQALASVRVILQDTRAPHRYDTASLIEHLNQAVAEARRVRPDLFVGSLVAGSLPYFTTAQTALPLPLPDWLYTPLVAFVAGMADMREDEFANDGRAITLITTFTAALRGESRWNG